MDKRSGTVSFRCTAETERALQTLALADDISVSDLCNSLAVEYIARKHRLYLSLASVFADGKGLPDLSDMPS